MKQVLESKYTPLIIPIVLLWVKTYIAYKVAFDITIENGLQEFILFINPLPFLLIVFGIALFVKEKRRNLYILISHLLISILLYSNVVFYRFFSDFITLPLIYQPGNFKGLDESFWAEIFLFDIFYFVDFFILAYLMWKKHHLFNISGISNLQRKVYFLMTAGLIFINLGISHLQSPDLFDRNFDREQLVKNIGPYNYALYDFYLQTKTSAQKVFAEDNDLIDIKHYIDSHFVKPNPDYFGIAKDRNVIVISLESTQNFVINRTVNGKEITPFLNDLIDESYYFNNFYHQTGQGKTSDSEFIVDNSLYGLGRGAVFFTHPKNEYMATPEILANHGYTTASFHANTKVFWNRDEMYQSLGYDRFYHLDYYDVTDDNSIGWGLKDIPFFEQSVSLLKELPQPFYAKLITLTNHHPFVLDESDTFIDTNVTESATLNQYLATVRYEDEALRLFFEQLKEEGLYDQSIIVIYGDHNGIIEKDFEVLSDFLGKEYNAHTVVEMQQVPMIIHIPGQEGKTISTVGGQIDLKPTILHLLGIETEGQLNFGHDLFSLDHPNLAIFRDGRFVTDQYIFAENTCYVKDSGKIIDGSYCEHYHDIVTKELNYSDQIIYGDLIRFYHKDLYDIKKE